MPLKAAVQRRPGQMRDAGLQGIETVVERQQGVFAEGDTHRLLLGAENARSDLLRSHRRIGDDVTLPPLGHPLRVETIASAQLREIVAFHRCIAALTAYLVVALPWRTWPIAPP